MINDQTESKYYCAGRFCKVRETCHRHTSSVSVSNASFNDYDLVHLRKYFRPCEFFIDRDEASGVVKIKPNDV